MADPVGRVIPPYRGDHSHASAATGRSSRGVELTNTPITKRLVESEIDQFLSSQERLLPMLRTPFVQSQTASGTEVEDLTEVERSGTPSSRGRSSSQSRDRGTSSGYGSAHSERSQSRTRHVQFEDEILQPSNDLAGIPQPLRTALTDVSTVFPPTLNIPPKMGSVNANLNDDPEGLRQRQLLDDAEQTSLVDSVLSRNQVLPLRREVQRLIKINASLHQQLIEASEQADNVRREYEQKLFELSASHTDLKFLHSQKTRKIEQLEATVEKLKARLKEVIDAKVAPALPGGKGAFEITRTLEPVPFELPAHRQDADPRAIAVLRAAQARVDTLLAEQEQAQLREKQARDREEQLRHKLEVQRIEIERLSKALAENTNWDKLQCDFELRQNEKELAMLRSRIDFANSERVRLEHLLVALGVDPNTAAPLGLDVHPADGAAATTATAAAIAAADRARAAAALRSATALAKAKQERKELAQREDYERLVASERKLKAQVNTLSAQVAQLRAQLALQSQSSQKDSQSDGAQSGAKHVRRRSASRASTERRGTGVQVAGDESSGDRSDLNRVAELTQELEEKKMRILALEAALAEAQSALEAAENEAASACQARDIATARSAELEAECAELKQKADMQPTSNEYELRNSLARAMQDVSQYQQRTSRLASEVQQLREVNGELSEERKRAEEKITKLMNDLVKAQDQAKESYAKQQESSIEIRRLTDENALLTNELRSLAGEVESLQRKEEQVVGELRRKVNALTVALASATGNAGAAGGAAGGDDLRASQGLYQQELERLKNRIETLDRQLKVAESKAAVSDARVKVLEKELGQAQAKLQSSEERIRSLTLLCERCEPARIELQGSLERLAIREEELLREVEQLKANLERARDQNAELERKGQASASQVKEYQDELQRLSNQLESTNGRCSALTQQLAELSGRLHAEQAHASELETQLQAARVQLAAQEKEMAQAAEAAAQREEADKSRIDDLTQALQRAEGDAQLLAQDNEQLARECEAARDLMNEYYNKCISAEERVRELTESFEQESAATATLLKAYEELNQRMETLRAVASRSTSDQEKNAATIRKLEQTITELVDELKQANTMRHSLETQLASISKTRMEEVKALADMQSEKASLLQDNQRLAAEAKALKQVDSVLNEQREQQTQRVIQLEAKVVELSEELASAISQRMQAEEQVSKLTKEIESLRAVTLQLRQDAKHHRKIAEEQLQQSRVECQALRAHIERLDHDLQTALKARVNV